MHCLRLISVVTFATTLLASAAPKPGNTRSTLTSRNIGDSCQSSADCHFRLERGQLYSVAGLDIMPREYCNPSSKICEEVAWDGDQCTVDDGCASRFCSSGVCKASSAGDSCQSNADCKGRGEFFCSSTNICMEARLPEGSSCMEDRQCAYQRCFNGICEKPAGAYGTACSANADCNADLECRVGPFSDGKKKCLLKGTKELGSPCTQKSDCAGNLVCTSGVCSVEERNCRMRNVDCFFDYQCCSGSCAHKSGVGSVSAKVCKE